MIETFDDIADAVTAIKLYVEVDGTPALTDDELETVLVASRVRDGNGVIVTDAAYELTIEFALAISKAWAVKAVRSASFYAFSTDGQSFSKDQVYDHCREQQAFWRAKVVGGQ